MTDPTSGSPLSRKQRIHRMRARSWVLQVLYEWEGRQDGRQLSDVVESVLARRRVDAERVPRVREHLEAVSDQLERIDGVLKDAMHNWRLDRLSRVDRCILRLAVAELLVLRDVPPKVVLQEAIRLAGQYGGQESPRFVNGVLDAVFRTHFPDG